MHSISAVHYILLYNFSEPTPVTTDQLDTPATGFVPITTTTAIGRPVGEETVLGGSSIAAIVTGAGFLVTLLILILLVIVLLLKRVKKKDSSNEFSTATLENNQQDGGGDAMVDTHTVTDTTVANNSTPDGIPVASNESYAMSVVLSANQAYEGPHYDNVGGEGGWGMHNTSRTRIL